MQGDPAGNPADNVNIQNHVSFIVQNGTDRP